MCPVSTQFRFTVIAPLKWRNECTYLADQAGCDTLGEWFRLVIKREVLQHFPEIGGCPDDYHQWLTQQLVNGDDNNKDCLKCDTQVALVKL